MSWDDQAGTVARLAGRLDHDALARRMIGVFKDQIPGYQRLPTAILEEQVLEVAAAGSRLFGRVAQDPDSLAGIDLSIFRDSARARADEGVPLDDVLRAYRLGGEVIWNALVGGAGSAAEREALLHAAGLMFRYIDTLCSAASATYLDERQYRLAEDARLVAQLIDVLASGSPVPEGLRALATRLGSPIQESYRPFALARPGQPATVHSQRAAALRLQGILAITEGDAVVGLVDPEFSPELLDRGRELLAIGEPASRAELRLALEDVRGLLAIARRRGQKHGLIDPVELAVPLLVSGAPRLAGQLRRRVLGPLEAYEGGVSGTLLRTLREYFDASMHRGRTAALLEVHPNTLDYRLGRIEELCEVTMSDPRDIARIELALAQLELEGP